MPVSKEVLRLLERAEMLEAYAQNLRAQASGDGIQPMSGEERRAALEYLVHVNAGGAPELWVRQHRQVYERLAARLEAVRNRGGGTS